MTRGIFGEGGPYDIRRTGGDQYTMKILLPIDSDGFTGRQCPAGACSPGYFKIKFGTGIQNVQAEAFCPYCRHADKPSEFFTEPQLQYATDIIVKEASLAIGDLIQDALRRDMSCPHCGLDHAVFGLAVWCPDCGTDIFMTHVGD